MTDYDVVVVGAGAAGLAAAVTAAEHGRSVLVAESTAAVGGASQYSAGLIMAAGTKFQREHGIDDDAEMLMHDYLAFNRWCVEAAVARRLAEESAPTIDWLAGHGVEISSIFFSGDDRLPRGHVVAGGGNALVQSLVGAARDLPSIEFAFGRRVDRLLTDGGTVTGVAVGSDEVSSAHVVLATGGFGANKQLWPKYLPRAVAAEWAFYIGPPSAQGDTFALAEQVDAQIVGVDRGLLNARPHFSQSMDSYYPGWLVFLDSDGRRFVNEMTAYSVIESTIRERGGRIWAIFDDASRVAAVPRSSAASKKYDMPTGSNWEDWITPVIDEMVDAGRVIRAEDLAQLAAAMDVEVPVLAGTVARYNADVAGGRDSMFEKPANVMRSIAQPPFFAAELRLCNIALTGAGPRIDADARVLDRGSTPIPGLLASGECAGGVLGDVYMGSGNALANAVVFGRIAGRTASVK